MRSILAKENGPKVVDVLIESGFNISRLSSRGFERLENIITRYGDDKIPAIANLFTGTKDVNRMLIFLDKIVAPDQYWSVLNKIKTSNLFDKTVTVNGMTINIPHFFDNPTSTYQYYHKVEGNLSYFATIEGQEGVLIIIDKTSDYVISNIRGILKSVAQREYDEYMEKDD